MRKLLYLDGIRGLAALAVVFSHYIQIFYPSALSGDPATVHFRLDTWYGQSPINLFFNGQFAVCLFFVLSGYVLSVKMLNHTSEPEMLLSLLRSSALRRYVRLALPAAISVFIVYILFLLDGFYFTDIKGLTFSTMRDIYETMSGNFYTMLKAAIFDPFFRPQAHNYNPVLWTMSYELLGSFLTFGFIALFGGVKRRWIVYVVLFIALCQTYFAAFLLGLLLADLWRNRWASRWLAAGVLLLGIYLGSAPYTPLSGTMYAPIETTVLHINSWLQLQLDPKVTAHTLGATMILFAVLRLSVFQWFFGLKPFAYLGKISFSIYLIHFTFLNSFSAYLFIQILPYTRYNIAFGSTFVFSMIPLFWLSHLYMHYVDEGAIKLSKIIEQKIK